ncbi:MULTISPECIES: MOSC domain-containing protein [Halobacterium]|uniref:MOSC domain-containing protein n=1 Tax=Halobacterium TaxID=2239 RepID=UPI00073E224B|nr:MULTISPECIES: MOSC N-terminal beta barrel domain-containing protein [Halobacterium]MCG1003086.1 MOSC N-terminal beta barrel domain-containing protein [Halobacterium noricense]
MPRIDRLRVYPVKGLDGTEVDAADVTEGGTLADDRTYAFFDDDGDVLNGKRTARVHDLDTDFDRDARELVVETRDGETERFHLDDDPGEAEAWFSEFFDEALALERDGELGYVDRREMGPSVVSTATLREVASWFDNLTVDSVRRRLRANVEVAGVPAFWEDRFVGADAPAFEAGGVRFEGITPCGRCVVPSRDPDTGEPTPDFRETFVQKREETFPEFADPEAFDHFYTLMLIADVPDANRGRTLHVGDEVRTI